MIANHRIRARNKSGPRSRTGSVARPWRIEPHRADSDRRIKQERTREAGDFGGVPQLMQVRPPARIAASDRRIRIRISSRVFRVMEGKPAQKQQGGVVQAGASRAPCRSSPEPSPSYQRLRPTSICVVVEVVHPALRRNDRRVAGVMVSQQVNGSGSAESPTRPRAANRTALPGTWTAVRPRSGENGVTDGTTFSIRLRVGIGDADRYAGAHRLTHGGRAPPRCRDGP